MFLAISTFIVGVIAGYIYFKSKHPAKSITEALKEPRDSLNVQYNEMISEVSVLIRESVEKANMDREIELARSVQKTILPPQSSDYDGVTVAGRCYVAGSCGGDWWYHSRKDNQVIVWLGDVTGHGVASALVASACRAVAASLNFSEVDRSISDWIGLMNDVVYDMTAGEVYVTVICLKLDLNSGRLDICNASHPSVIQIRTRDNESEIMDEPMNPPVGRARGAKYQSLESKLDSGEGLFLMSDGLLDMQPPPDVRWTLKGLTKFLSIALNKNRSAVDLIEDVDTLFKASSALGPFPDDVSFAAIYRG